MQLPAGRLLIRRWRYEDAPRLLDIQSRAARAMLGHGFAAGLPEITAVNHTDNDPSALFVMTAERCRGLQAKSD